MLLYSNTFLEKCNSLEHPDLKPRFVRGEHLGRGFADLGNEQFLFLLDNQAVSLFTGDRISIADEEKSHFFLIPSIDFLSAFLEKESYDVLSLELIQRREWVLKVSDEKTKEELEFKSKTMHEVFLDATLNVIAKIEK